MRKLVYLCVLLAIPSSAWGQGVRVDNPAGPATKNVQNFLAPIPGAQIAVCTSSGTGLPCSPLVPTSPVTLCTDSSCSVAAANPFLADTNGNWGAWLLPGTYKVSITATGVTGQLLTVTVPVTPGGNIVFTGQDSFSQQITSTVSTGTAPFSIASTTVVPNLNAQLHNGLTAPGSAIVGINDTQTLTAKTLTAPTITNPTITGGGSWAGSPAITTPTIDGFPAAHAAAQVSAATNFGTALGTQTIVTSLSSTGMVSLSFNLVVVTAGVGCSAATNSVSVNLVNFTTQGGSASSFNPSANMNITGNGAVDNGEPGSGVAGFNDVTTFVAKAGTALSYTTTSTLGSTGCTTTPQYAIYAKAFF